MILPNSDTPSHMNNNGAMCIVHGDYDGALPILRNALEVVLNNRNLQRGTRKQQDSVQINICTTDWSGHQHHHQRNGYVYRSPVMITYKSDEGLPFNYSDGSYMPKEMCAIAFNLSLAMHLSALQQSDMALRNSVLGKAELLYKKTLQMQVAENVHLSNCHNVYIANNLAMIHAALGREEEKNQCLGFVLSELVLVMETGNESYADEADGLMSNASSVILSNAYTPAAA